MTIVYFKQVTCVRQSNRETTQPEKAALAVRLSTYTRFHVVLGLGISPDSRSRRFQIPGQVRDLGLRDPVPGLELREQESEKKRHAVLHFSAKTRHLTSAEVQTSRVACRKPRSCIIFVLFNNQYHGKGLPVVCSNNEPGDTSSLRPSTLRSLQL